MVFLESLVYLFKINIKINYFTIWGFNYVQVLTLCYEKQTHTVIIENVW